MYLQVLCGSCCCKAAKLILLRVLGCNLGAVPLGFGAPFGRTILEAGPLKGFGLVLALGYDLRGAT